MVSLIACEGRMIRAIEHARVTISMEVESSPTVLHIFESENSKHILFGTVDGRIGLLDILMCVVNLLIEFFIYLSCMSSVYSLLPDG